MQTTQLTRQRLLEVLAYDAASGRFTWLQPSSPRVFIGSPAGTLHKGSGYRRLMVDRRKYQEHRLVWLAATGDFPPNLIDHINGVKNDNRIANLRLATRKQNNENVKLRVDNTSGFKGATRKPDGRWEAQIQTNKTKMYLGLFDTPEAAHAAYVHAATNLFTHYANR